MLFGIKSLLYVFAEDEMGLGALHMLQSSIILHQLVKTKIIR